MVKYEFVECPDSSGKHRMAYTEWGDRDNEKVLICVHGLSRTARDFDFLAMALESEYRVICLDIVGRGESDWLSKQSDYAIPQYVSDVLTLIKHLHLTKVDWVGTSMGGIIGMVMASQEKSVIDKLIINDVGAWLPAEALEGVAKNTWEVPELSSWSQVQAYVRKRYAGNGKLTDEQWEHQAKYTVKLIDDGSGTGEKYKIHYDPGIGVELKGYKKGRLKPVDLWEIWSQVRCPVFLLHGEESDLLLPETIEEMQSIYPQMEVKHLANCGHPPSLLISEHIELVKNWLLGDRATGSTGDRPVG